MKDPSTPLHVLPLVANSNTVKLHQIFVAKWTVIANSYTLAKVQEQENKKDKIKYLYTP